jgi:hypothetical protein
MPFLLPAEFQKKLSPTTQKIYKGKLNKIAKEGFETVDSLKTNAKAVVEVIKTLTGDGMTDKDQYSRRTYLSAIFWVGKFPKKNPYYTYWQKCLPELDTTTGLKWLKKKDFVDT